MQTASIKHYRETDTPYQNQNTLWTLCSITHSSSSHQSVHFHPGSINKIHARTEGINIWLRIVLRPNPSYWRCWRYLGTVPIWVNGVLLSNDKGITTWHGTEPMPSVYEPCLWQLKALPKFHAGRGVTRQLGVVRLRYSIWSQQKTDAL